MVIGIDARMYGSGFGLARYTQQLIHHLLLQPTGDEFVLFVAKEHQGLAAVIAEHPHVAVRLVVADIPWYSLKEQLLFCYAIKKQHVDLMHFPHWNIPIWYTAPYVVTIHDLIMYHYPRPEATTLGPVKFWCKDMVHRLVVRHAVAAAKHIIVTSEFTKEDVHDTLGVPREKMTVTYQAPFSVAKGHLSAAVVRKKYGIHKPFVMYVGAAYPHKNVDMLVAAWKHYVREYESDLQLVLVGKESYFYTRLFPSIAHDASIIYTGFVPDEELATLYAESHAYIFLSLYEGFGLPPLEALSAKVPVVASHRSCLPEVLGEAALYVDPENMDQIVSAIHTVCTDEHIRHQLLAHARIELQRYSWQLLAQKTLDIYHKCI